MVEEEGSALLKKKREQRNKFNSLFGLKEFFDRLGYGFAPHQFVTILFFLTGASALVVGIINGLRHLLSDLFSSFMQYYSSLKTMDKTFISSSGILFGFSFLLLVLAIRLRSVWLFSLALLIGSFGVVAYGELYTRLLDSTITYEKRSRFLRYKTYYGLLITAIAFLLSGFLLEIFGMGGTSTTIANFTIPVSGYFIAFELAAIAFILSGFIIRKLSVKTKKTTYPVMKAVKEYTHQALSQLQLFRKNKYLMLLFIGAILLAVVESLGATFYGYYIYETFKDVFLGGFLNVAVIFVTAILVSFFSPTLIKFLKKKIGLAPMFVFGTLLMAIIPLVLIYNLYFYAVLLAVVIGVLGASIVGVSQGLLTRKLLARSERTLFFQSLHLLMIIPFLILVPLGAYIATIYSFTTLFIVLLFTLLALIAPLYFVLVMLTNRQKL